MVFISDVDEGEDHIVAPTRAGANPPATVVSSATVAPTNTVPAASQVTLPRNQSRRGRGGGQTRTSAATSRRTQQTQASTIIGDLPAPLPNSLSGVVPFVSALSRRSGAMQVSETLGSLPPPAPNAMSGTVPFTSTVSRTSERMLMSSTVVNLDPPPLPNSTSGAVPFAPPPSLRVPIPPVIDLTGDNNFTSELRNRGSLAMDTTSTISRLTGVAQPTLTSASTTSQQGQTQPYPWQIVTESAGMAVRAPDASVVTQQPTTTHNELATDLENRPPPQTRRNKNRAIRRRQARIYYRQQKNNQTGNSNFMLLLKYFFNFI